MAGTSPAKSAPHILRRRTAVKLITTGVAGLAAGCGISTIFTSLSSSPYSFRFFTNSEGALVTALCEQIVPHDDAPGATEAGVVHYIDRQLDGLLSRHKTTYRRGLVALVQTCLELEKRPFTDLPVERQIAFLKRIESGNVPLAAWAETSPANFFSLLVDHAMQGFYGSPRHGGNRGYVSYKMLRLDYPQIIGRTRTRKI